MRRIALALAATAITSPAQDKAVATLCELTPSPPPAAEVGFVDRAHDGDRGAREASGARIAESAVAAIERLATARGHELNLRIGDPNGLV
jgi:hypothetical protein